MKYFCTTHDDRQPIIIISILHVHIVQRTHTNRHETLVNCKRQYTCSLRRLHSDKIHIYFLICRLYRRFHLFQLNLHRVAHTSKTHIKVKRQISHIGTSYNDRLRTAFRDINQPKFSSFHFNLNRRIIEPNITSMITTFIEI